MIFLLMLIYATLKFDHLVNRKNPTINSYNERGAIETTEKTNFFDKGLHFAFGVEGFLDKELKEDPHYVKMLVRLMRHVDGEEQDTILPYRKCRPEDWDSFAEPNDEAKFRFERYRNDPLHNLYCLDWDVLKDEIEIWGT